MIFVMVWKNSYFMWTLEEAKKRFPQENPISDFKMSVVLARTDWNSTSIVWDNPVAHM